MCTTSFTLFSPQTQTQHTVNCQTALGLIHSDMPYERSIPHATITKTFGVFNKKNQTKLEHVSPEELRCRLACAEYTTSEKDYHNCQTMCGNFDD